ncbi:hypothetical protein Bca101_018180 [Brassica carinata]
MNEDLTRPITKRKSEMLCLIYCKPSSFSKSFLGIKIANQAPSVNHLLFADDSLFFSLANVKTAKKLQRIFATYEAISVQAINLSKSSVIFGKKVRAEVKTKMRNLLGIHNEGGIRKYLGLPEEVGSKKKEMFSYIIEKVKAVRLGWKQRFIEIVKTITVILPTENTNANRVIKSNDIANRNNSLS